MNRAVSQDGSKQRDEGGAEPQNRVPAVSLCPNPDQALMGIVIIEGHRGRTRLPHEATFEANFISTQQYTSTLSARDAHLSRHEARSLAVPELVKDASERDVVCTGALSLWPAVEMSKADMPSASQGNWVVEEREGGERRRNRGRGNQWLAAHNFLGALVHGLFPPLWGSICCVPMLGLREGNLRGPPHPLPLLQEEHSMGRGLRGHPTLPPHQIFSCAT